MPNYDINTQLKCFTLNDLSESHLAEWASLDCKLDLNNLQVFTSISGNNSLSEITEFITNLYCNNNCRECVRKPLSYLLQDYEMTLEEVRNYIDISIACKAKPTTLRLVGGNTLLWPHLLPALAMLREAQQKGVIKGIQLYISPVEEELKLINSIEQFFSLILVTKRLDNSHVIETIRELYPGRVNVIVAEQHYYNPRRPIPGIITEMKSCYCGVANSTYFLNRIWACPNFPFIWFKARGSFHAMEIKKFTVSLEEYFSGAIVWNRGHFHGVCNMCVNVETLWKQQPLVSI